MSVLGAAAARLSRQDMLQGLTVLLAALSLTLAMRWPSGGAVVNESWLAVAPVRAILLAFGGLAWGASVGMRPRRSELGIAREPAPEAPPFGEPAWRAEVVATLASLLAMAVISAPFDVLSHAASYPNLHLGWTLLVPVMAAAGHFGLGIALGRLTRLAGVSALLPLFVPGIVAAAAWLDVSLGVSLGSPWFAALEPSPWFVAVMAALALFVAWAARPRRGGPA